MLMRVDNHSSKKAVVSFSFCVKQKYGQARHVKGKLEVAAGKFKQWQQKKQNEEEKKGNTSLLSFAIGKKQSGIINEEGKSWLLLIEDNQDPKLHKSLDSLYEDAGSLPNSLVAQRIREFSNNGKAQINKTATQILQSWDNSRRNTE